MYSRILVAIDGGPTAERALGEAIQLVQKLGSELVTTHVIDNSCLAYDIGYIDVGTFIEALVKQDSQTVADACVRAEKAGVHAHSAVVGDPIGTFDIGTAIEQATHSTST